MKARFISPHFDDAVYSCSRLMSVMKENGWSIEILTVFSRTPNEQLRKEEDLVAASSLSATTRHLEFLDAPLRKNFRGQVLFEDPADEPELVQEVTRRLRQIQDEDPAELVFAPMGIGWHIDHLLCHAAIQGLKSQIIFYEDAPYREVAGFSSLRRQRIPQFDFEPTLQSFFSKKWVREYLQDWSKQVLFEKLNSQRRLTLEKPVHECQWAQSLAEASQRPALPDLYPSQISFKSESLSEFYWIQF